MSEPWPVIAAILALLVVLGLGVVLVTRLGRSRGRHASPRRPSRSSFRQRAEEQPPPPKKRVAVVLNPSKFADVTAARELVTQTVQAHDDWDAPLLLETTIEDPGFDQAREALAEGVDLVCAIGGDGTVRAVSHVLAGTSVPMGLIPAGTGNLLGRNLGLPLDVAEALDIALTGRNRHIDVGWATLDPEPEAEPIDSATSRDKAIADGATPTAGEVMSRTDAATTGFAGSDRALAEQVSVEAHPGADAATPEDAPADARVDVPAADVPAAGEVIDITTTTDEASGIDATAANQHAFLVMAGVGLDASIMHGTSEEAKARIGWGAYVATGAKNLLGARFATRLRIDGGEPIRHTARTVVVGNCGRLTGGITLMPDAEVDDGILDVVAVTPKGIVGWAGVAIHVLAKRGRNHPKLDRYRCQTVLVSLDAPQLVEVDGDVVGTAKRVRFEVRPKSLIVRTSPSAPKLEPTGE